MNLNVQIYTTIDDTTQDAITCCLRERCCSSAWHKSSARDVHVPPAARGRAHLSLPGRRCSPGRRCVGARVSLCWTPCCLLPGSHPNQCQSWASVFWVDLLVLLFGEMVQYGIVATCAASWPAGDGWPQWAPCLQMVLFLAGIPVDPGLQEIILCCGTVPDKCLPAG